MPWHARALDSTWKPQRPSVSRIAPWLAGSRSARMISEAQRDRADRAQVFGDVLADLAVAACRAACQHAVLVYELDREAVELGLGVVVDRPLVFEAAADTRVEL